MYVRIKAKRAMFCNVAFRTERISYPVPTPGAIAGALRNVYAKPQMDYVIKSILVVNRPRYESQMSRYLPNKASGAAVDKIVNSVPRSEMVLKDVDYLVNLEIVQDSRHKATDGSTVRKHYEILERRLKSGQYFNPPYLGTKECSCEITYLSAEEAQKIGTELKGDYPLPIMPHHVPLNPLTDRPGNKTVFYHPKMIDGLIDCTRDAEYAICEEGDFLKNLVNLYDMHGEKLGMPRDGYQTAKITYKLIIGTDGEPTALVPVLVNDKGKPASVQMIMPLGAAKSSNVSANFLWAEADYLFGLDDKRGEQKVKAFAKKVRDVAGEEPPERLAAVTKFYERIDEWNDRITELTEPYFDVATVKGSGNITFEVDGVLVAEDPEVMATWEKWCFAERRGKVGKCLVTGREEMLCEGHPLVKGVKNAGSMGRLISIDKDTGSLSSYGHVGLENAPISVSASFKLHAALNWMLANDGYRQDTERGTLVFWTRNGCINLQHGIKALFDDGQPRVEDIPNGEPFYVMELRGNGAGRVYVKSYRRFVTGDNTEGLSDYLVGQELPVNLNKLWEDVKMKETNRAEVLGKLFAQIQIAQMDAIPSTIQNGGIERTYFSVAAARPDVAFGRLLNHLKVYLAKKDYGIGVKIADTLAELDQFDPAYPSRFTAQEKTMFAHSYTKHIAALKAERMESIKEAAAKKKDIEKNEEEDIKK